MRGLLWASAYLIGPTPSLLPPSPAPCSPRACLSPLLDHHLVFSVSPALGPGFRTACAQAHLVRSEVSHPPCGKEAGSFMPTAPAQAAPPTSPTVGPEMPELCAVGHPGSWQRGASMCPHMTARYLGRKLIAWEEPATFRLPWWGDLGQVICPGEIPGISPVTWER